MQFQKCLICFSLVLALSWQRQILIRHFVVFEEALPFFYDSQGQAPFVFYNWQKLRKSIGYPHFTVFVLQLGSLREEKIARDSSTRVNGNRN